MPVQKPFCCVFVGRSRGVDGVASVRVHVRVLVVMKVTRLVRRRDDCFLLTIAALLAAVVVEEERLVRPNMAVKKGTKTCHVNAYILIYFIPVRDPFSVVLFLPLPVVCMARSVWLDGDEDSGDDGDRKRALSCLVG